MKVAVIERKLFGGTCVNTGCIPTKTLVASARAAYTARRAADFGVMIDGTVTVDMKKVKARKDDVAGRSNHEIPEWMKKTSNLTVLKGQARFEGPRTVSMGDEVLEADKIFINVGARAFIPPMPGLDRVDYLTNSGMMQVDFLPEHLIIIGGSYIGLEFGQMYRRFGSQVTIVEKGSHLIARDDEDVSKAVKDILESEGISIRLNADCMAAEKDGDKVRVKLDCDKGDKAVSGSHLLLAVGWMINFARMCPAYGRWVTAMERAPLPTHPITILRSLQQIYWMMTPVGQATAFFATVCISIHHWDAPG
jgi:pyruvate/2-oxoglutarate dehydrogenase complex dihydrolipoamide dehydrogenase (E3) component